MSLPRISVVSRTSHPFAPQGRRGIPSRRPPRPSSPPLPPSPPPAGVAGQSPGDAGGGDLSFPASWRAGRGLSLLGGGALRETLVQRGRVVLVAVSFCGGAPWQRVVAGGRLGPALGTSGPDGLVRAQMGLSGPGCCGCGTPWRWWR
jgi:hypothetical protein